MIHLRLVVPTDLTEKVLALLGSLPSALNLIHLAGAARAPEGDLVLVDVAREDASTVIGRLQQLGLGERGTIATIEIDAAVSTLAVAAEQAAVGSPADAVVWEQVEARTSETAVLSGSFLAFMILATLIAAVGIVTDSIILIIGAMIVGPEFGPLAGLCVALVQRRPRWRGGRWRRCSSGSPSRSPSPTAQRCCSVRWISFRSRSARTRRRSSSPTRTATP